MTKCASAICRYAFADNIPTNAEGLGHQPLKDAAARASSSILCASSAPLGTSQLPPTHFTAGSASQLPAVSNLMPPVAQKRAVWKGAARAFNAGRPPEV